jgi:hypothetical protein
MVQGVHSARRPCEVLYSVNSIDHGVKAIQTNYGRVDYDHQTLTCQENISYRLRVTSDISACEVSMRMCQDAFDQESGSSSPTVLDFKVRSADFQVRNQQYFSELNCKLSGSVARQITFFHVYREELGHMDGFEVVKSPPERGFSVECYNHKGCRDRISRLLHSTEWLVDEFPSSNADFLIGICENELTRLIEQDSFFSKEFNFNQ